MRFVIISDDMRTTRLFTVTEARARLHQVLELAETGNEVIIHNSETATDYQAVVASTLPKEAE